MGERRDWTFEAEIAAFPVVPEGYVENLAAALAHIGQSAGELLASTERMAWLWSQVVALTGGAYRPAFRL